MLGGGYWALMANGDLEVGSGGVHQTRERTGRAGKAASFVTGRVVVLVVSLR